MTYFYLNLSSWHLAFMTNSLQGYRTSLFILGNFCGLTVTDWVHSNWNVLIVNWFISNMQINHRQSEIHLAEALINNVSHIINIFHQVSTWYRCDRQFPICGWWPKQLWHKRKDCSGHSFPLRSQIQPMDQSGIFEWKTHFLSFEVSQFWPFF